MAGKLKIYRTAIGFHDAYVAAPSKKAALAAWGSSKDLFARGAAEIVDHTPLAAKLIAAPGTVIKQSRGTAEEQFAALPAKRVAKAKPKRADPPRSKPKPPRPSRAKLDAAERALEAAEAAQAEASEALAKREADLARERRALVAAHADERRSLERARDVERRAYDEAVADWSE